MADLHFKNIFGKSLRHHVENAGKGVCMGIKIPPSILVHDLLAIEIKMLYTVTK